MGRLTTHVLDIAGGVPARDVLIDLYRAEGDARVPLVSMRTNADGRCERPLLEGAALQAGRYALVFHVADYFRARGQAVSELPFLDEVVIQFGIAAPEQHYHVPLLVSPWSYSTYRGS